MPPDCFTESLNSESSIGIGIGPPLIRKGQISLKIKSLTVAIILISVSALSVFLVSCAKAPTKETTDAVAALQKLQAATQVGVNYQTYGQLLIEAKAKVNDAVKSLPEGELKTEISGAMDSYATRPQFGAERLKGTRYIVITQSRIRR